MYITKVRYDTCLQGLNCHCNKRKQLIQSNQLEPKQWAISLKTFKSHDQLNKVPPNNKWMTPCELCGRSVISRSALNLTALSMDTDVPGTLPLALQMFTYQTHGETHFFVKDTTCLIEVRGREAADSSIPRDANGFCGCTSNHFSPNRTERTNARRNHPVSNSQGLLDSAMTNHSCGAHS